MSFVQVVTLATDLNLADPTVALWVCMGVIALCVLLDAPAIASVVRIAYRRHRVSRRSRRSAGAHGPRLRAQAQTH